MTYPYLLTALVVVAAAALFVFAVSIQDRTRFCIDQTRSPENKYIDGFLVAARRKASRNIVIVAVSLTVALVAYGAAMHGWWITLALPVVGFVLGAGIELRLPSWMSSCAKARLRRMLDKQAARCHQQGDTLAEREFRAGLRALNEWTPEHNAQRGNTLPGREGLTAGERDTASKLDCHLVYYDDLFERNSDSGSSSSFLAAVYMKVEDAQAHVRQRPQPFSTEGAEVWDGYEYSGPRNLLAAFDSGIVSGEQVKRLLAGEHGGPNYR